MAWSALEAWRTGHPWQYEAVTGIVLLALAYVGARLLSALIGWLLTRSTATDPPSVERRLTLALRKPLTYLFFLFGVWGALHRAPLPLEWILRLDAALFAAGVLLAAVALMRGWSVGLHWYVNESAFGRADRLAGEFAPLFNKVGRVFVVLVATITVLQHVGVNVQSLVVSLGVGSLAVGLAAQDTLANMFAGFTLMMDRPFRVGDRIQLSTGEAGDVLYVGMRATQIKTYDETVLVVPNAVLVKDRLINMSQPTRAMTARVEVALPYGTALDRAREILRDAAREHPAVVPEPGPTVLVQRFGDLGVQALLVFQVRDYTELAVARSEIQDTIYRRLAEEGMGIATLGGEMAAARRPGGRA